MSIESPKSTFEAVPGWTFEEIAALIKLDYFHNDFYLSMNPDVALSGVNPLIHYLQYGWREGRHPSEKIKTTEIEFLENIKENLRNPLNLFELNR
jgi:hypothetical protein